MCSSQQSISSTVKLPKPGSDGNTTYVTAPEYNTRDDHGLPCSQNSTNASSHILSEEVASLEIGGTSLQTKNWMTEESTESKFFPLDFSPYYHIWKFPK